MCVDSQASESAASLWAHTVEAANVAAATATEKANALLKEGKMSGTQEKHEDPTNPSFGTEVPELPTGTPLSSTSTAVEEPTTVFTTVPDAITEQETIPMTVEQSTDVSSEDVATM